MVKSNVKYTIVENIPDCHGAIEICGRYLLNKVRLLLCPFIDLLTALTLVFEIGMTSPVRNKKSK